MDIGSKFLTRSDLKIVQLGSTRYNTNVQFTQKYFSLILRQITESRKYASTSSLNVDVIYKIFSYASTNAIE